MHDSFCLNGYKVLYLWRCYKLHNIIKYSEDSQYNPKTVSLFVSADSEESNTPVKSGCP
jgi:hypothetical protein